MTCVHIKLGTNAPPCLGCQNGQEGGGPAASTQIENNQLQGPTATVGVFVDSGSAYETPETTGASHLLEYLAFKSTTNRTSFRITRELEGMGANVVASASREQVPLLGQQSYQTPGRIGGWYPNGGEQIERGGSTIFCRPVSNECSGVMHDRGVTGVESWGGNASIRYFCGADTACKGVQHAQKILLIKFGDPPFGFEKSLRLVLFAH